jgi:hypothetical protein
MSSSTGRRRAIVIAILLACGARVATPAAGQETTGVPGPRAIESDPIKCWWKTDKSAVHIGERFTLTLTCGVIETSSIKVVADPNRVDPASVELTPFEVLGGTRHADLDAPPWHYFQYSYTLRLLGDEFFGKDVDVPSIQMTYNVQSASGGTEGRSQLYLLPPLRMRILSLVPGTASDIWDASPETFADIESRLLRAKETLVAAGILFAFAAVLAALAVVRTTARYRARVPSVMRPLPIGAVLRGTAREAERLKSEVAVEGWTPDLVGRALALFRIAGAVAMGRPVAQRLVDVDVPGREGHLVLRKGMLRPKRALVSASTTAAAIAGELADGGRRSNARTQAMLEEIREALQLFGAARYSRDGHFDAAALDTAFEGGMRAIRHVRSKKRWPTRAAEELATAVTELRGAVWSR